MNKTFLPSAAALAVAFAFAGCGDSDDSEVLSGPSSVMPADTPVYVEAIIRPEGETADNVDALLAEVGEIGILGSVADPGDLIVGQLESQAAAAGVDFSYAEDVEPWLGESLGLAVSAPSGEEDSFIAALETTDEAAARESLDSLLAEDGVTYEDGEYEGVSYISAPGDSYRVGVFGGHVVLAPPADFEAAVDASEGDSLASGDKLQDSLAQLEDDSLATVFVDLGQLEGFVSSPEDAEELEQAAEVVPEIFDGAIAVSAGVSAADQIYLDYSTPLIDGQPESGASPLLESAAGDAIGALAIEDLGAFGPPIADLFERAAEAGADLEDFPEEGIAGAFEEQTGVSFDDATAAIGDGSLWVRGDVPDGIEVAGEIEATDPEVAADLIGAIEQEIEDEGSAELGPPVGGSDVGFSAIEAQTDTASAECSSVGDVAECLPSGGAHAELPFSNVELDGDVIRFGFFADEKAAVDSNADTAGDFGDSETFSAGQEALGDDFEYLGAFDLGPVLDKFVDGPSIDDAISGASPESLIGGFLAQKLGVVAYGVRYDDEVSIQRYVVRLAE